MSLPDPPHGIPKSSWQNTPENVRELTISLIHEVNDLRSNQIPYMPAGAQKFSCKNSAGFRFEKEITSVQSRKLQTALRQIRKELRMISWGTKNPWNPDDEFCYDTNRDITYFKNDIARLAKIGYRFFNSISRDLLDDPTDKSLLKKRKRQIVEPGTLILEYRTGVTSSLPISLVYDYPLDSDYAVEDYVLCSKFQNFLLNEQSLEYSPCFHGQCSAFHDDSKKTVCPSGFWGYRHFIGSPLAEQNAKSVKRPRNLTKDAQLFVGFSTDEKFIKRDHHFANLQSIEGIKVQLAKSRDEVKKALKSTIPDILYFYCHGGFEDGTPYIQVGPNTERGITPDFFSSHDITWTISPLLIFLNGCRTAALEPSNILDFVSQFAINSNVLGVVGTQVTISENLAVNFAERFFQRFLIYKQPLGKAARGTRLSLLKQLNPLGLVYTFYASPDIKMGY